MTDTNDTGTKVLCMNGKWYEREYESDTDLPRGILIKHVISPEWKEQVAAGRKAAAEKHAANRLTDKEMIGLLKIQIRRLEREVEYLEKSSAKTERKFEEMRKKLYDILKDSE